MCENHEIRKQPSIRNFSYNFLDNQIYAAVGKDSGRIASEILSARTKADSGNIYLTANLSRTTENERAVVLPANNSEFPGHLRVKTICRIMESLYPAITVCV